MPNGGENQLPIDNYCKDELLTVEDEGRIQDVGAVVLVLGDSVILDVGDVAIRLVVHVLTDHLVHITHFVLMLHRGRVGLHIILRFLFISLSSVLVAIRISTVNPGSEHYMPGFGFLTFPCYFKTFPSLTPTFFISPLISRNFTNPIRGRFL